MKILFDESGSVDWDKLEKYLKRQSGGQVSKINARDIQEQYLDKIRKWAEKYLEGTSPTYKFICQSGGTADTEDLKSSEGNLMRVRVPPLAEPNWLKNLNTSRGEPMSDIGFGIKESTFRKSGLFARREARGRCEYKWQGREHSHTCNRFKPHRSNHVCNCGSSRKFNLESKR